MSMKPYLEQVKKVILRRFNPIYGDSRTCQCGHPYHRHFDPCDDMAPIGCKYCGCSEFVEAGEPLATFRLPQPEADTHHLLEVYAEKSTIVLLGVTGHGKSVLALMLAAQRLSDDPATELHWASGIDWPRGDVELPAH